MTEKSSNNRPVRQKQNKSAERPGKGSGFWIGLICFSSIWMFGLGILVGRGTAPVQFDIEKIQNKLAALEEALIKKEREQFEDLSKAVNKKEHLEFYEDLKKSETVHAVTAVKKEPAAEKPDAGKPVAVKESTIQPEKEQPAEMMQKPADGGEESKITDQPAGGDFRWTIQVSSLKDRAAAEKMVEKLKQKGYSAYSMASSISGKGRWYRVRVGPFRHKEEAEKMLSRLKSEKYDALLITL